jgi:hypothetical protein
MIYFDSDMSKKNTVVLLIYIVKQMYFSDDLEPQQYN